MSANTFHYPNYWEERLSRKLWGFNVNPRTNRVDEYERYNRIRRMQYEAENRRWKAQTRMLGSALLFLVVLLAIVSGVR